MSKKKGEEMTRESINGIFDGMTEILLKKNKDYKGASFDLGMNGNMVHIWDKTSRLRNMVENRLKGEEPNFESIQDTLKDIIGYAVIGLHILEEEEKEEQEKE
jgi:hypothetical protein